MKKRIALLLVGMLLLSGCAGKVVDELSQELPSAGESGTESAEERPAQGEGQETPEGEKGLPFVKIETLNASRRTDDDETELAWITWCNVSLSGAGYEKGAEAVERLLGHTQDEVEKEADAMAADAKENYEVISRGEVYEYFAPYTSENICEVTRLDSRVLSLRESYYDYTGGAHGYGGEQGVTIDLQSGLKLELPHMLEDMAGFWSRAEELVLAELAEREDELFEDYQATVSQELETTAWYMDGAGIEFCFNTYAIAPYASGTIVVCVPYGEVASYMKPEYLNNQEEYVVKLPQNERVQFVGAGGESMEIAFENRKLDDYSYELYLVLNGQDNPLEGDIWVSSAYLFHRANGKTFLVYDFDWASDDYETVVCDVSEGTVNDTDRVGASIGQGSIGLDRLGLSFIIQILGNHTSGMEYQLTEDGRLEPLEERYEFVRWGDGDGYGLTLIKDLPVEVDGAQTVVPAGSKIILTATDYEGTVWFKTVDGSMEGTLYYERDEDGFPLYIDGVSEYEYFENLPYAG
ncbi:MAG: DUF3298 and DUF4163 domain-containing protein [Butyrivibrio sp.]|nr:DUF3298 and DUF4163 domain-containing protein [Muribaculum sp.]MCM1553604.1 DUF3298 and DUF4163 domain-containing protein [Butyrivibrio sp.]